MQASIQQHKVTTTKEKAPKVDSEDHDVYTACKYRKSIVSFRRKYVFPVKSLCFTLEDTELLTKLNTADVVALEANYYTRCLVSLYKCARKTKVEGYRDTDKKEALSGIAFAELVRYIEDMHQLDEET